MNRQELLDGFSLLGGPLHRLGRRWGLVRGTTNTVALGLALGLFLWIVLVVLAFFEGISDRIFSVSLIAGHIRLLVAIPLLFICEAWLDPRVTVFVRTLVRSEIVPKSALPGLEAEIARISRWKDSWLPEMLCLLTAVLIAFAPQLNLGASSAPDASRAFSQMPLTGQWYWLVCLTIFRFLVLRWVLRLLLWWYFLWRVARLELNLVPTHPDGAGGLGCLETVQTEFVPLILSISAVQSAAFAESIVAGTMTLAAVYPTLVVMLVVDAALFVVPLFFFAPKLWQCRVTGLGAYMALAARYVNDFDRKWMGASPTPGEPLLGTADLQSLADLSNSVNIVRTMRTVPVSQRLLMLLATSALLPFLPLLLFEYPMADLAEKMFKMMLGL